jgi:hypothetical protein
MPNEERLIVIYNNCYRLEVVSYKKFQLFESQNLLEVFTRDEIINLGEPRKWRGVKEQTDGM